MSPSASGSKAVLGSRSPWTSNTPLEILGCFSTDDLLDHSAEQTNLLTLLFCRLYSYRNVCASTGPAAGYTSCAKACTGQNCDDMPSSSGASFEGDASSLFHMLQAHGRNAAGTAQREDKGWCRLLQQQDWVAGLAVKGPQHRHHAIYRPHCCNGW